MPVADAGLETVAFAPDGMTLAAAGQNAVLYRLDVTTGAHPPECGMAAEYHSPLCVLTGRANDRHGRQ
jgi:hypothetical protein